MEKKTELLKHFAHIFEHLFSHFRFIVEIKKSFQKGTLTEKAIDFKNIHHLNI